jgi:hypothetical protein
MSYRDATPEGRLRELRKYTGGTWYKSAEGLLVLCGRTMKHALPPTVQHVTDLALPRAPNKDEALVLKGFNDFTPGGRAKGGESERGLRNFAGRDNPGRPIPPHARRVSVVAGTFSLRLTEMDVDAGDLVEMREAVVSVKDVIISHFLS